jgi:hypothetical protein
MRPLAKAVIKAGLVSLDSLAELRRWGVAVEVQEVQPIEDLDEVVTILREALEGSEQVRLQEADIDVLRRFLDPDRQRKGNLTVKGEGTSSTFPITFCVTRMGEYAMPWKSESIRDMMILGDSFLRFTDSEGKEHTVYFMDSRESYFGERCTFMICTPETSNER